MRRVRRVGLSALVLGAAAASAGCDWRAFDTLAGQTPVLAVSAPSDYQASDDFGGVLLPVAPPADGSVAARFLAGAVGQAAVAVVDVNAAGHASAGSLSGGAFDQLAMNPVTAMAEIPGAGKALLGVPGAAEVLTVDLAPPRATAVFDSSIEAQFGVAVAAGYATGGAAPDVFIASAATLHVYVAGHTPALTPPAGDPCPIALAADLPAASRVARPIVIGALTGGAVVVAVGTPAVSAPGTVSLFNVASGGVACAQMLQATEPGFGRALAVGDFNADGKPDLLVGAPPRAYLYLGPIGTAPTPIAITDGDDPQGGFGAALAAFDLDGKPGDEALIGDPAATVAGGTNAGAVRVVTGPALATTLPLTLTAHDPASGAVFGSTLAGLTFCPAAPCGPSPTRLPLIGAASTVFVYFTLGPTDPRKP